MILTQTQIDTRLNSDLNLSNKIIKLKESQTEVIVKDGINNHTGNTNNTRLSENERVAIGVLAHSIDQETVGAIFGVSSAHVSDLKRANRNMGGNEKVLDIELQAKISERLNKTKLTIQERAAEKLLGALGLLTDEKMENCTAKDIASITTSMSQVVRNISGDSGRQEAGKTSVRIVLHQPKQANESAFDCIDLVSQ